MLDARRATRFAIVTHAVRSLSRTGQVRVGRDGRWTTRGGARPCEERWQEPCPTARAPAATPYSARQAPPYRNSTTLSGGIVCHFAASRVNLTVPSRAYPTIERD